MRMLFILCLSVCWHGGTLLAQLKMEQESRVKAAKVPILARQFIDSCFGTTKVKWYLEKSLSGHSYEAKLKFAKQKYSIEFDTLGGLKEVEHTIRLEQIPDSSRQKIEIQLKSTFKKYKIIKIQEQWLGERTTLYAKIKARELPTPLVINYEIVLMGKTDELYKSFELTFDNHGEIINRLEIIDSNHHNLIY